MLAEDCRLLVHVQRAVAVAGHQAEARVAGDLAVDAEQEAADRMPVAFATVAAIGALAQEPSALNQPSGASLPASPSLAWRRRSPTLSRR